MNAAPLLLLAILAQPPTAPRPSTDAGAKVEVPAAIRRLVEAHNERRAEADLPPLTIAPKLVDAAKAHARDMAENAFMAHEGSDDSTPAERVKRAGYPYAKTGENVAAGQRTVKQVMDAWMDSPDHRANILGEFSEIGAARVEGEGGRPYWAVEFGTPIPTLDPASAASGVIARINGLREEAGKPTLEISPALAEAAGKGAAKLAEADAAPRSEAELSAPALVRAEGYRYRKLQASAASGVSTAEDLVDRFAREESTRQILLGKFEHVGVGYAQAEGSSMPYWVILLAEPLRR